MRPAGEVHQALLKAATELASPERSPTQRELAVKAQVGHDAARRTVQNMRRAGHLVWVRDRRVPYRNKPVAEYAPPDVAEQLQPVVVDVLRVWAA